MAFCTHRFRRGLLMMAALAVPCSAFAQYNGENVRGDNGLSAGSQPGPGFYASFVFYNYDVKSLRATDGTELVSLGVQSVKFIAPAVAVVTKLKILGGNYGFAVIPVTGIENLIDVPRFGISTGKGYAISDIYFQPINLGWHTKSADFIAAYAFFAPTGDFQQHEGLGMWSHEISGGTTVYFGEARRFSAATAAFFEMHTKKQDQDLRVGNLLTLEGGVGARFAKGAGALGLAYYAQWKVSDDSGSDVPVVALTALRIYGRQRLYGIGPEISTPVFAKGATVGLVTFRYFWEFGVRSTFQGQGLFVSFTLARLWGA
jgi:hypothetical protein